MDLSIDCPEQVAALCGLRMVIKDIFSPFFPAGSAIYDICPFATYSVVYMEYIDCAFACNSLGS